MITLHTWKTPNGRKPANMLEEVGLPYRVQGVDLSKDEQFAPSFLAIAPNNKIPAIVDDDAGGRTQTLFESGAILTYLAQKTGQLLPSSGPAHWATLEWLHWQIGGLGPMLGQLNFFAVRSDGKTPPAVDRFTEEGVRLLGVLKRRLTDNGYLNGSAYSIADIAAFAWVYAARTEMSAVLGPSIEASPAILDWFARIGQRPAVAMGMKVLAD